MDTVHRLCMTTPIFNTLYWSTNYTYEGYHAQTVHDNSNLIISSTAELCITAKHVIQYPTQVTRTVWTRDGELTLKEGCPIVTHLPPLIYLKIRVSLMNNLIHKKGVASSAVIGKLNRESRILSGEDMIHPVKTFKKKIFHQRSPETIKYCSDFVSHIGMVNCSGQTVTKCTCITDIAADLELSYAAEQCLIAHAKRAYF